MFNTNKNLANSRFVHYTEPRLVKRLSILNAIVTDDDALDEEIAEAALLRKEVKELLQVFRMCQDIGLDTNGMSAADIIETVTEEPIEKMQKATPGGALAQDIMTKTSNAMKSTKNVTKKASGGLGAWLLKWSQGESK